MRQTAVFYSCGHAVLDFTVRLTKLITEASEQQEGNGGAGSGLRTNNAPLRSRRKDNPPSTMHRPIRRSEIRVVGGIYGSTRLQGRNQSDDDDDDDDDNDASSGALRVVAVLCSVVNDASAAQTHAEQLFFDERLDQPW